MSAGISAEECSCYCQDSCCAPNLARGGYDAINPSCPIHGDES